MGFSSLHGTEICCGLKWFRDPGENADGDKVENLKGGPNVKGESFLLQYLASFAYFSSFCGLKMGDELNSFALECNLLTTSFFYFVSVII